MSVQSDTAAGGSPFERAVSDAIQRVLRDTGREPRPVGPGMLLGADLGLDSLDIAQAIVLLERELGVDPFRRPPAGQDRPGIRTVGDLVDVYGRACAAQRSPAG